MLGLFSMEGLLKQRTGMIIEVTPFATMVIVLHDMTSFLVEERQWGHSNLDFIALGRLK